VTLHAFIISWTGQHANCLTIASAIAPHADQLTLVYSDRDDVVTVAAPCPTIRTPDAWFFGGKFKACLDACTSDLLLVITGDVSCADWPRLAKNCRESFASFAELGAWAPLIDYTSWTLPLTTLENVAGTSLHAVAQTDSIVLALRKPVITRLRNFDYRNNTYGWGIDWAAMAYCYAHGLIAVVDASIRVSHPQSTTYDEQACVAQMHDFLRQLDAAERHSYLQLQARLRRQTGATLPPGATLPDWLFESSDAIPLGDDSVLMCRIKPLGE